MNHRFLIATLRTRWRAVLLPVVLALTGCALTNPYPSVKHVATSVAPGQASTITLREAKQYANNAIDEFNRKIMDRSKFRGNMAIAGLILAGGAVADALIDPSDDLIKIVSAAGVTGTAGLQWLDDPRRQNLYAFGITALICAKDAIAPLESVQGLGTANAGLLEAMESLQNGKIGVQVERAFSQDTMLNLTADSLIAVAEQVLSAAQSAYDNGVRLQFKRTHAGPALENAVDRILNDVTKGIIATEKDIASLREMISGLYFQAQNFLTIPTGNVLGTQAEGEGLDDKTEKMLAEKRPSSALKASLGTLALAIGSAVANSRRVAALVSAVANDDSLARLRQCGVDVDEALPGIIITPSNVLQFDHGAAATKGFVMQGGNGQYASALIGSALGLTVQHREPFSAYVDVSITADTPPASYQIVVRDTTNRQHGQVTVNVVTKPPSASLGSPHSPATAANPCPDENLSKVCVVQKLLNIWKFLEVDATGSCRDMTKAAMTEFYELSGVTGNVGCDDLDLDGFKQKSLTFAEQTKNEIGDPAVDLRIYMLERVMKDTGAVLSDDSPDGTIDAAERSALGMSEDDARDVNKLEDKIRELRREGEGDQ